MDAEHEVACNLTWNVVVVVLSEATQAFAKFLSEVYSVATINERVHAAI